jgi:hypothetical protein
MRRFLRDNSLSLGFGALFVLVVIGQAFAGLAEFNDQQRAAQLPETTLVEYVTSADFGVDVSENWQSEFLQFCLYVVGTVWLLQHGSPESKKPERAGGESDKDMKVGRYARADSPKWAKVGGWRTALYSNSLGLLMLTIFLLAWTAQAVAGWSAFNEDQLRDLVGPISFPAYLTTGEFWNRSLQNWQSELLAIGSFSVFAIYLRQRGSPESKPVGEPHHTTGRTG